MNKHSNYAVSVIENDIIFSTNNPNKSSVTIQREYSPSGKGYIFSDGEATRYSMKDSVTLRLLNNETYNTAEMLRRSAVKKSIAYELATSSKISWRITVDGCLDTIVYTKPLFDTNKTSLFAYIKSGKAAKFADNNKNNIQDIKSWLYDQNKNLSDSLIIKMSNILSELTQSKYREFTTEDKIPIIKSFAGIKYNVSTNLKADYYYLFATNNENELNEFIKEVSLNEFEMGEINIDKSLSCFRANNKGGHLTIFLIGVNKDWSKRIIPVGKVAMDNIKPRVYSDKSSLNELSATVASHINTEDIILLSERVKVIMPKHIPNISGLLSISTNSFRGNHVNFEFSSFENSDIESVSIKREIHRDYMKWSLKQETKVIKLSDKKSPYHFTYELDLGIGDNFIPITVTDKRGNKTEYAYKISMVRVEDNNPDINIDNNIDIYQ